MPTTRRCHHDVKLEKDLVPFLAPIRYCRTTARPPGLPSRVQFGGADRGWAKRSRQFGLPYLQLQPGGVHGALSCGHLEARHSMLAAKGCIAITTESLAVNIYGAALYLSTRLAYDPHADADALLETTTWLLRSQAGRS